MQKIIFVLFGLISMFFIEKNPQKTPNQFKEINELDTINLELFIEDLLNQKRFISKNLACKGDNGYSSRYDALAHGDKICTCHNLKIDLEKQVHKVIRVGEKELSIKDISEEIALICNCTQKIEYRGNKYYIFKSSLKKCTGKGCTVLWHFCYSPNTQEWIYFQTYLIADGNYFGDLNQDGKMDYLKLEIEGKEENFLKITPFIQNKEGKMVQYKNNQNENYEILMSFENNLYEMRKVKIIRKKWFE